MKRFMRVEEILNISSNNNTNNAKRINNKQYQNTSK